jgi:outer membrane protein OmpA-like peptidoglycan-associated protein
VLAVGLLGLGLGDLTVINMVLLPRYLAASPVGHRATLRSTPGPSVALLTAQPPPGGTARPLEPSSPPPSPLPGTVSPPAPAAAPPQPLDSAMAPPTPLAIAPPEAPPAEEPAPPPADLFPDLQFALNATWLSPSSRATLNQLTEALKQAPQRRVVLRGHADRMGPEELNRALSLARARQARRYMQVRGIAPDRIEIKSFGSRRPADQAVTYAARARNRRVEIEVH